MDNSAIDSFTATAGLVGGPESPATRLEVEFAIAALDLRRGQCVLDLPCGNGRHARRLADHGLQVTAVDIDAGSLEIARRDAAHHDAEYVQLDARAVAALGRTFDAAISLCSCIGYFEDEGGDRAAIEAIASAVRPGGGFVLSMANGTVVARAGSTRSAFEVGERLIERFDTYCERDRCLEREFVVLDKRTDEQVRIHHRRRLYAPDEITAQLAGCGITLIGIASDFHGAAFAPEQSPHAIYLGRRQP